MRVRLRRDGHQSADGTHRLGYPLIRQWHGQPVAGILLLESSPFITGKILHIGSGQIGDHLPGAYRLLLVVPQDAGPAGRRRCRKPAICGPLQVPESHSRHLSCVVESSVPEAAERHVRAICPVTGKFALCQ